MHKVSQFKMLRSCLLHTDVLEVTSVLAEGDELGISLRRIYLEIVTYMRLPVGSMI